MVADAALAAAPVTVSATEGIALAGATVATFTDLNPNAAISDFAAAIDWGDTTTSTGTVVANAGGGFSVTGAHTYADEGSQQVSLSITDKGGRTASATSTVTVADAALAAAGVNVSATEGIALTGATVATFTDLNPTAAIGDFAATIDWGDTATSTGTVMANAGGGFSITGTHTYADEGSQQVSVAITDKGGRTASTTSTATVADAALAAAPVTVSATEGIALAGATVATFTDLNPNAGLSDFAATINWGDQQSSNGTVSYSAGVYSVAGSHSYAEEGSYAVSTTIADKGGSSVTVRSTASISDPAVIATGGYQLRVLQGVDPGSQVVAAFTDPGGPEGNTPDHYSASINWGDGSPAALGTISFDANSKVFTVTGDHVYQQAGNFAITTTIDHEGIISTATSTAQALQPGKVTGGGEIGKGRNFGFTAQSDSSGQAKGNLEYQDKANGINLHSVSITLVGVQSDGMHAVITGTATVNGVAGYSFTAMMADNGEPGIGVDQFRIQISDSIHYDSNAFAANNGLLTSGNIQVHETGGGVGAAASQPGIGQSDAAVIPTPQPASVVLSPTGSQAASKFTETPGLTGSTPTSSTSLGVTFSSSGGVTSVAFGLSYDPELVTLAGAELGADLPEGAKLGFTTVENGDRAEARIEITSTDPLPGGAIELASLKLAGTIEDTGQAGLLGVRVDEVNGALSAGFQAAAPAKIRLPHANIEAAPLREHLADSDWNGQPLDMRVASPAARIRLPITVDQGPDSDSIERADEPSDSIGVTAAATNDIRIAIPEGGSSLGAESVALQIDGAWNLQFNKAPESDQAGGRIRIPLLAVAKAAMAQHPER
jgi:hypothetical protein